MNRRHFLTAIGGLGLTGGSVLAVRGDFPNLFGESSSLPVRVETIDAPGSSAGEVTVPNAGSPTLIDLFATWCAPCKEQMDELSSVYEEYGDRVTFVSITNERLGDTLTERDIRGWWRRHHGAWAVGVDPNSDLMAALGAGGIPYHAIADASGTIRWQQAGLSTAETLRTELDRVLEAP
ncbi:TlpA family protein disulfide reductase [Halobellus captivus]|uniref:TlpA family protein disulfide reductase n=1 Tax=Halobellus captivus TaxID=2592614 RepID=UPI0011A5FC9A|nr:TlpA disulfide reductase family protein [Halobellus captivus]